MSITAKDRADHYRTEYDSRNPRLRMNILGYFLAEGGIPGDELLETVQTFVDYVSANTEEFAAYIESLEDGTNLKSKVDNLQINFDEEDNSGYL